MEAGNVVVYIDFEDSAASVVGRLVDLMVPPAIILERFAYVHPAEPLKLETARRDFASLVALRPSLAVFDGVTESLALEGLSNAPSSHQLWRSALIEGSIVE